jgi:hypothetical protein
MKTVDAAIIITKNPRSEEFKEGIITYMNKITLHATCTGYGGTPMEPNVPKPIFIFDALEDLIINKGFPRDQVVLRVDPIIPTQKGIKKAIDVMMMFKPLLGDNMRVRYSLITMYKHVRARFNRVGWSNPYTANHSIPSNQMINDFIATLDAYPFTFEACATMTKHRVGCISQKDLEILKIKEIVTGKSNQRAACMCPSQKTELLTKRNRCEHQCLYCYWHG